MEKYIVKVCEDLTCWYLNGKLHRPDGPAVEDSDGDKKWYLNGEQFSKEDFEQTTAPFDEIIIINGIKYKRM
jgi:hypothetical protein